MPSRAGQDHRGPELRAEVPPAVIAREGAFTAAGHERWPVCRVGLTSNIGMKEFNRSLLEYYAHPGRTPAPPRNFARRALDCVLECETRVLIVDDLHFLDGRTKRHRGQ